MDKKHVIWSDIDLNLDDWREGLEELYPNYPEDELYAIMCKSNAENLYDERYNLNIQLSRPILVIADLGLWNGRRSAYKEIESGNVSDCLYSDCDACEWYVDEAGDLRCDASHHDGTNHYLYRTYKDDVTDEQIEDLQDKIYNGIATREDIESVTRRLGDEIAEVYGWELAPVKELKSVDDVIRSCENASKNGEVDRDFEKGASSIDKSEYSLYR